MPDFVTFGACWVPGFAHRESLLRRIRPATSAVLTAVAVLAFGWVEDLAGRRPPQLLPGGRRKPVVPVPAVVPVNT
ncbi:hypothetical protein Q5425_43800 [Amycolatopsis sp. A133]|uniref:hypothetical protein n=1 Tax=Amycolatopsis sp. A133 TaxID=3064472 RepID=UPI0027FF20FA|nr:hypothetical protein [Amycolatopsis sp. A133]MDQ7810694.1 hypothetical protein [Amycolatopsis sp. A133]